MEEYQRYLPGRVVIPTLIEAKNPRQVYHSFR